MSKKKAVLLTIFWAAVMLISLDHLFDIPGLIARHHQGILAKTFGSWVDWAVAAMMVLVSGIFTLVHTKLWLQARSTTSEVR
jgi:hypothetical protein